MNVRTEVLLVCVAVLVVLFLAIFSWGPSRQQQVAPRSIPPLTASEAQQLQQMPTFQYLVSYTDQGFEPSTLTVKKGDIVRFTNNSSQQLWVASVGQGGAQIYPGTSNCGGSSFDSCQAFGPGDFWQFQFTEPGTYNFQNNTDTRKDGSVTVTVQ